MVAMYSRGVFWSLSTICSAYSDLPLPLPPVIKNSIFFSPFIWFFHIAGRHAEILPAPADWSNRTDEEILHISFLSHVRSPIPVFLPVFLHGSWCRSSRCPSNETHDPALSFRLLLKADLP